MDGWWAGFFDETYANLGLAQTDEATIDVIVALLGVPPGARIFDQCCGVGRIAVPLAQRGYRVTGVDLIERYVEIARSRATPACELHAADAFTFVAPVPCDGGINWFTSFGYLADDRVNVEMLRRAHASLVPGARFALEHMSAPYVLGNFRPVMIDRHAGDLWVLKEPAIDFTTGMITTSWTFLRPDGTREVRTVENRLYMPHELSRLFRDAGFEEVQLFGPDGKPFERTSRRLIVVGRKTA